jgi:beta-lactam-binding protein with PASTA domain/tRNA A-37 threonylcarbamoyl transferase component Bud32
VDTTARLAVDPLIGRLLDGRYAVREQIARGGMATVYAAVDTRLDRDVAVKVMHPALAEDPDFVARFHREARAAARIRSPYAVGVTDQGTDTSAQSGAPVVFLVMELVHGRTLRAVLSDHRRLNPTEALDILAPTAEALAAAHAAGIVHRDVKPENILLGDDGRVQVTDFGLARAVEPSTLTAAAGLLIGTMAYLAPEQVSAGNSEAPVNERADVYAAGIVLYEMLVGRPPFDGDTPLAVAYRHVHEDVPAPSESVPGLPPELDWLVRRMTSRDPADRPVDGRALVAEIRSVQRALTRHEQDGEAPAARSVTDAPYPDAKPQRTQAIRLDDAGASDNTRTMTVKKPKKRRRKGWVVAFLLVLVTAGVATAGWWYGSGRYVEVRDVRGFTQAEATKALTDDHVGVTVDSRVYSETMPVGEVAQQKPGPGGRVARGHDVHIAVSKGPQMYPVPGVAKESVEDAKADLTKAHLTFGTQSTDYNMTVPKGAVVSTDPAEGTPLRSGTSVNVLVSAGRAPVTVPDFANADLAQTKAFLQNAGLKVTTADAYDDNIPAGNVIRVKTHPPVLKGDTVVVVVSKGPQQVVVPDVRGLSSEAATRKLNDNGLKADFRDTGLGDTIWYQHPSAGKTVDHGSSVTIVPL